MIVERGREDVGGGRFGRSAHSGGEHGTQDRAHGTG